MSPHPRVESLQPEINRVGPIFDGGSSAFPIARRRQQLRTDCLRTRILFAAGLTGFGRGPGHFLHAKLHAGAEMATAVNLMFLMDFGLGNSESQGGYS